MIDFIAEEGSGYNPKGAMVSIIFFLFPFILFAQERQSLKGKAIADIMLVEDLKVKNLNTNVSVVTDAEGNFTISASEGDVLEFSSPTFKTYAHTLTKTDFKEELFVVRVEPVATMLDEVVVTGLTGNLAVDSKNTKVILLNTKFKDDFDASQINMGIAGGFSLDTPKKRPEYPEVEHRLFSKILLETYPESFFTETIKVPREKLGLFLHFCDNEAKRYLLMPKNEAELIAYLKERYISFTRQSPE